MVLANELVSLNRDGTFQVYFSIQLAVVIYNKRCASVDPLESSYPKQVCRSEAFIVVIR